MPSASPQTKLIQVNPKLQRANSIVVDIGDHYLVVTGLKKKSKNRKTGAMLQTFFIDKSKLISEPKIFGSGCGDCPLNDECYVNKEKLAVRAAVGRLVRGEPTSYVWCSWQELMVLIENRAVRWGSYGDPSVLGVKKFEEASRVIDFHTGYTHFWRDHPELAPFLMASVEDQAGQLLAVALGFRTFTVLRENAEPPSNSILCPSNRGIQCINCRLCDGKKSTEDMRKNIHIPLH